MNQYSISAVIVTYNRRQLFNRCVKALASQVYLPENVYIIDNASTDGTYEEALELGVVNQRSYGISWHYLRNEKNEGGAGGFYKGMKSAMVLSSPDAVWVMDDDGQPDSECLSSLVSYLGEYDYIAPIVLSDDDHETCSFAPNHEKLDDFCRISNSHDGMIDGWASPFNGVLFSSRLIKTIGFPKREMFIWGDEVNYHGRAVNSGFLPVTIIKARHYHPINRQSSIRYKWGSILDVSNEWKLYCFLRNRFYNKIVLSECKVRGLCSDLKLSFLYFLYYWKLGEYGKCRVVIDAFFSALFGNFSGMEKYCK